MRLPVWPLWLMSALGLAFAQYPPGYTEPRACASCHAEIAAAYAKTPMANTFGRLSPSPQLPALETFYHEPSGQFFQLSQTPGKLPLLRRNEAGGQHALEKEIHYWIGSGNHARSYANRSPAGDLFELPLTWYAEQQGHWAMSPAYDSPQHAGFSRKITYRCLFCHTSYPDLPPRADLWDNATRLPAHMPTAIDCQRCHGPGVRHVQAATSKQPLAQVRAAITNPARLSAQRKEEVCLQCHLETTNSPLPGFLKLPHRGVFSYRPGEPLEGYVLHFDHAPGRGYDGKLEFASAPYRLRQSACYQKSGGQLTCTTCHNPHRSTTSPEQDKSCLSCHQPLPAAHTAQGNCASCHMPKERQDDAPHVTIADHRIVRHPGPRRKLGPEAYRGPVVLYYPEKLADNAQQDLWLAVAQIANQSDLEAGIPKLESALLRAKPTEPQFYSDLATAYRLTARDPLPLYREALRRDPDNLSALVGLGDETSLRRAIKLTPWNNELHKLLANRLGNQGNRTGAIAHLRAVLAADPDASDLWNSLGLLQLQSGAAAEAQASLEEAVRLRPELPRLRANYATVLARNRNLPAAIREFESALSLGPLAEVHSAYGLALMGAGNSLAARRQFEAALKLNPVLSNTHNNLGSACEKLGDTTAAIHHYREAIRLQPDFALAHFNLGLALLSTQSFDAARTALTTAANLARQSDDTGLLRAIESALRRFPAPW